MTKTGADNMAVGGWRISQLSVLVGDYVRFNDINIQVHLRDEWWKVTGIDGTTFHLVNAAGRTARITPTRDVRVYRHDYSQGKATAR